MSNVVKFIAFALATAALLPQAARAEPVRNESAIRVVYSDLNLSTKAGAQSLLRRIKVAANTACGGRVSPKLIVSTIRRQTCMQDATNRAVATVDAPMLTALFNSRFSATKTASR